MSAQRHTHRPFNEVFGKFYTKISYLFFYISCKNTIPKTMELLNIRIRPLKFCRKKAPKSKQMGMSTKHTIIKKRGHN